MLLQRQSQHLMNVSCHQNQHVAATRAQTSVTQSGWSQESSPAQKDLLFRMQGQNKAGLYAAEPTSPPFTPLHT